MAGSWVRTRAESGGLEIHCRPDPSGARLDPAGARTGRVRYFGVLFARSARAWEPSWSSRKRLQIGLFGPLIRASGCHRKNAAPVATRYGSLTAPLPDHPVPITTTRNHPSNKACSPRSRYRAPLVPRPTLLRSHRAGQHRRGAKDPKTAEKPPDPNSSGSPRGTTRNVTPDPSGVAARLPHRRPDVCGEAPGPESPIRPAQPGEWAGHGTPKPDPGGDAPGPERRRAWTRVRSPDEPNPSRASHRRAAPGSTRRSGRVHPEHSPAPHRNSAYGPARVGRVHLGTPATRFSAGAAAFQAPNLVPHCAQPRSGQPPAPGQWCFRYSLAATVFRPPGGCFGLLTLVSSLVSPVRAAVCRYEPPAGPGRSAGRTPTERGRTRRSAAGPRRTSHLDRSSGDATGQLPAWNRTTPDMPPDPPADRPGPARNAAGPLRRDPALRDTFTPLALAVPVVRAGQTSQLPTFLVLAVFHSAACAPSVPSCLSTALYGHRIWCIAAFFFPPVFILPFMLRPLCLAASWYASDRRGRPICCIVPSRRSWPSAVVGRVSMTPLSSGWSRG